MASASPLELFFDVAGFTALWRILASLLLLALTGALWLWIRESAIYRRFGGVLVFVAVVLVAEALIPWVAHGSAVGMVLRAIALPGSLFGVVRGLVLVADITARRRHTAFSTIFRDLSTILVYGVIILVVARMELNVDVEDDHAVD